MFKAFNLSFSKELTDFSACGQTLNESNQAAIRLVLDEFVVGEGVLDGSRLQEHWFPQVEADVFISHSHQDLNVATALAGWLSATFGLEPFIDSCVWGYADHLLKQVDDKYCINPDGKTYNYEKRNGSTSHIHMMLATALGMMIDRTECLFFLNTPQSITSNQAASKTRSPWLFMELAVSRIIQQKRRGDHRKGIHKLAARLEEGRVQMEFGVDLTSLTRIDESILAKWQRRHTMQRSEYPLDALYSICSPQAITD